MIRTTITLDEKQLETAKRLTGIKRTSDVVNAGLSQIIKVSSAKRLALLCGSDPDAYAASRNR